MLEPQRLFSGRVPLGVVHSKNCWSKSELFTFFDDRVPIVQNPMLQKFVPHGFCRACYALVWIGEFSNFI